MCLRIALIIILIWFSTSNSFVDILINFVLSPAFSNLTGTSLTILGVLFACIYTIRTSAEGNMHNANANFVANVTDKRIRKIWLKDSFKWRYLCAINTKIATMFLYSFILLGITFFITLIVPFIKISLKLIGLCIIFLMFLSIFNLLRGFWCYIKPNKKLYKSKEKSCLTEFSHWAFKTDLLSYECPPRDSIFNEEAKEIYKIYE